MQIIINIDPIIAPDTNVVFVAMDKDYGDYIMVVELIETLEAYIICLKQLCANKLMHDHGKPPDNITPDFAQKMQAISMAQLFPPDESNIIKPNKGS